MSQDIYGSEFFPTTTMTHDMLKFRPRVELNLIIKLKHIFIINLIYLYYDKYVVFIYESF